MMPPCDYAKNNDTATRSRWTRRAFCRSAVAAAGALAAGMFVHPQAATAAATTEPAGSVAARKKAFLRFWGITVTPNDGNPKGSPAVRGMGGNSWNNLFYVIPQVAMAEAEPGSVKALSGVTQYIWPRTLQFINDLKDCSDFVINAALRMLYLYPQSTLLGEQKLEQMKRAVLDFVYWYDEPTPHNGVMLTENHQILFSTAELLAGQLYPDEQFTRVQKPGTWRAARARERVLRWLDWRLRFGFSEWLSSHYYDEDLVAMFNLQQFADDPQIVQQAEAVLQIVLFEMAVNSHRGVFNATQGRVYSLATLRPRLSLTSPVSWLCWGRGWFDQRLSMSGICLATSPYEPPAVMHRIATHEPAELECAQRSSLTMDDLQRHGIDPADPANFPLFQSTGLWTDGRYLPFPAEFLPPDNRYSQSIKARRRAFERRVAEGNPDPSALDQHALPTVHPYTFRTPQFMLSCAQDWRKGERGYQQHIWTAVLDEEAQVFTTNPHVDTNRVDRWAGNGSNPKAVAHRNVLICLYQIPTAAWTAAQTHAWFPRFAFDEVLEQRGWVFGRKGDGYVALRSTQPAAWIEPDEQFFTRYWYRGHTPAPLPAADRPCEYLAEGATNAWICEMGNPALHGSFPRFVAAISAAAVEGDVSHLRYGSPSLGPVETGWDRPLLVNGQAITLHHDDRFRSPYLTSPFGTREHPTRFSG
jgi:hypothetical protein